MARLPTAQQNAALDAMFVTGTVYYLALCTGDPGTTGANEVVGGSYTRQPITFLAAAAGSKVSGGVDAAQSFAGMPVEAGGVPYFAIFTSLSGGTYMGGGATSGLSGAIVAGEAVAFASGAITASLS